MNFLEKKMALQLLNRTKDKLGYDDLDEMLDDLEKKLEADPDTLDVDKESLRDTRDLIRMVRGEI